MVHAATLAGMLACVASLQLCMHWHPSACNHTPNDVAPLAACTATTMRWQVLQLPKPLWQEVMELLGPSYAAQARAARREEGDE